MGSRTRALLRARLLQWLPVWALGVSGAWADDIRLTNGATVTGVIEQDTAEEITVDIGIGLRLTLKRSEIAQIRVASARENALLRAEWRGSQAGSSPSASPSARSVPPARSSRSEPAAAASPGTSPGQRPPSFAATDLTGRRHSLEQYRGKVLVLHFWASWCPNCQGEIPKLLQLYSQWHAQGVRVVSISTDEDLATLRRFVSSHGLTYPVIADRQAGSSIARQYGVSGIPTTYVLTPAGTIAFRFVGSGDYASAVERAL